MKLKKDIHGGFLIPARAMRGTHTLKSSDDEGVERRHSFQILVDYLPESDGHVARIDLDIGVTLFVPGLVQFEGQDLRSRAYKKRLTIMWREFEEWKAFKGVEEVNYNLKNH